MKVLIVTLFGLLLVACTMSEESLPCSLDADCPSTESCIERRCTVVDTAQFSLEGTVVNIDGEPVVGANVAVIREEEYRDCSSRFSSSPFTHFDGSRARDTTDARGHYQLPTLSEGTYTILFWAYGYFGSIASPVSLFGADKTYDYVMNVEGTVLGGSIGSLNFGQATLAWCGDRLVAAVAPDVLIYSSGDPRHCSTTNRGRFQLQIGAENCLLDSISTHRDTPPDTEAFFYNSECSSPSRPSWHQALCVGIGYTLHEDTCAGRDVTLRILMSMPENVVAMAPSSVCDALLP